MGNTALHRLNHLSESSSRAGEPIQNILILLVLISWIWHPLLAIAKTDVSQENVTESPKYHELNNTDLLEQTKQLIDEPWQALRTKMRGLKMSKHLLDHAHLAVKSFPLPEATTLPSTDNENASLETTKIRANQAKSRYKALQQQERLTRTERVRLDIYIEHIDQSLLAVNTLINTINQLGLPLLEIRLRVDDGTLSSDQIPDILDSNWLDTQHQTLLLQREALEAQSLSAKQELKLAIERIGVAKNAKIQSGALYKSAKIRYEEMRKRQELQQEYAGQTPKTLRAGLLELQEEMVRLNGALQLSLNQFSRSQARFTQLQQKIESLSPPEGVGHLQLGGALHTEEVVQRTQEINDVMAYYTQFIEHLQAQAKILDELVELGNLCQSDATVLNDHLFKMQVPVALLERAISTGDFKAEATPEESPAKALTKVKTAAARAMEKVLVAMEQMEEQHSEVARQIEAARVVRQEAAEHLEALDAAARAMDQARRWALELTELTGQEVARRFQETAKQLTTHTDALQHVTDALRSTQAEAEEAKLHFDSLTDSLLRGAQQEVALEKLNIIGTLYTFAGLELPTHLKMDGSQEAAAVASQSGDPTVHTIADYQNLLVTRERIIEEREKQRINLKAALITLNAKIEAYTEALGTTYILMQKQYVNAVELKKRMGSRELEHDEIPDGITEALSQERTHQLEVHMADLRNQKAHREQEIEALVQPTATLARLQESLHDIISSVGQRLDVMHDLEKWQRDFKRTLRELSNIELTSLEQSATRRLEANASWEERLLGLVASARADGITDLLSSYYQELIELESKQINLREQKTLSERAVELIEAEKTSILTILPILKQRARQLKEVEEEAWVIIQAQLSPKKSATILQAYEAKTGKRLPTPPPIVEEDKKEKNCEGRGVPIRAARCRRGSQQMDPTV